MREPDHILPAKPSGRWLREQERLFRRMRKMERTGHKHADPLQPVHPHRVADVVDFLEGGAGVGPFEYDYLIDKSWAAKVAAGDGTEGQEFETFHGHTFKVYSNLKAAVDDANANRQANSQSSSFMIVGTGVEGGSPGVHYVADTTITVDPPTSGSYLFYGSGADSVTIEGTMTSGALFSIATLVNDSMVGFYDLELRTSQAIRLIQGGGSTRGVIDNCWLRLANANATGLHTGNAGVGWNISNTNFEGIGVGISGLLMSVRLNGGVMAVGTGVQMNNAVQVSCSNVKFNCSVADVSIGSTTGAQVFTASGGCEFNKGIKFSGNNVWFDNFVIDGCTFLLGAGGVGIDYAGANSVLAARSHSLTGNTFRASHSSVIGIRGGSDGPKHVTVVSNSFRGFTADNEIVDMDRAADENDIGHNTTDSGATLPDTGVGHAGSGPTNYTLPAATELTIATGEITVTQSHHTIDTEGDVASDDLDTINGLAANQLYVLRPEHDDRTVVLKHNTGNILIKGNADISLDDVHDAVWGLSPDGVILYIL